MVIFPKLSSLAGIEGKFGMEIYICPYLVRFRSRGEHNLWSDRNSETKLPGT